MKTIAVFHPSSELYGADRILVNALQAYPPEVKKIVYLKFDGPLLAFLKKQVPNVEVKVCADLPIIYRAIFTPIGVLKFLWSWISFAIFIGGENRTNKFCSAYVNTLSCSFLLPLLALLGIRRFVHVHEIIEHPRMIGLLTAWLSERFANEVICVSEAVSRQLKTYRPAITRKISVLHNGIDAIPVKIGQQKHTLDFFLFGRIMEKKGQWYLLDALVSLGKKQLNGARFTLMGGVVPGQEEKQEELLRRIKAADLQDFVHVKPFASDISMAMQAADVCLVPSKMKDPFPTTVLEAMSAGRPVIATNHGGASEVIEAHTNGFLVGPNQPEKLGRCILELIENRDKVMLMGANAKKKFESAFTKSHFAQNWAAMIQQNQFI